MIVKHRFLILAVGLFLAAALCLVILDAHDPYIIDAIIGLSVAYKAFDNMDGFRRMIGRQPNTRAAVLLFGLFHGFALPPDGIDPLGTGNARTRGRPLVRSSSSSIASLTTRR
jgi:HupE/UreJ protein